MLENLNNQYTLISPEKVNQFIDSHKNTLKILNAMEPHLKRHFPNNEFSLEICDELGWTTETKLLLNVQIPQEMFFNGILDHFNDIYREIEPVIEDIENTVVLFPKIDNLDVDRMRNTNAVNVIARTAYFNNYNNGTIQREISFRGIPKKQQREEVLEYCKTHKNPNISDIVYDLQLPLFDVDDIIIELEEEGLELDIQYQGDDMVTRLELFKKEMEPAKEIYTKEIKDFAKKYDELGEMTLRERPDIDTADYIYSFEKLEGTSENTLDKTLTELYDHMNQFSKANGIEEFARNAIISYK
jgi:hypothetical protein